MGQELVRFTGATELVEKLDHEISSTAPTANQKLLRELLDGEVSPDASRFYYPPDIEVDAAEWSIEAADQIALASPTQLAAQDNRTADPKACWTGFALGIACAGAIGFAFFLSFATVVTPQPSVAALVPVEMEPKATISSTPTYSDAVLVQQTPAATSQTIWDKLRRFHSSAGKFSQPRIRLVSGPLRERLDGAQPNARKAALSNPLLEPVVAVDEPMAGGERVGTQKKALVPRIINAAFVKEDRAPGEHHKVSAVGAREPIVIERITPTAITTKPSASAVQTSVANAPSAAPQAAGYADVSDLAEQPASSLTIQSVDQSPPVPAKRPAYTTAGRSVKVIRSSLTPTARTKVRLGERRSQSLVGGKKQRRLKTVSPARLQKNRRLAKQTTPLTTQEMPTWAQMAFGANNIGSR